MSGVFRRWSCSGSWGGFVRVSRSVVQVGQVNRFGGSVLSAAFEQGLNMKFMGSVLSGMFTHPRGVRASAPCRFFVLVSASLALRKALCFGRGSACYNKAHQYAPSAPDAAAPRRCAYRYVAPGSSP
jgi:hypothetical protein